MRRLIFTCIALIFTTAVFAQTDSTTIKKKKRDKKYIIEVQEHQEPDKVLHAEPLYIDLIRDLGARKGESEWNIGMGITDNLNYDHYEALVEYEWAPVNRLGLEIELPFTFYTPNSKDRPNSLPSHRLESIKTAAQWSFFVSQKWNTTLALGYINELVLTDIDKITTTPMLQGNIYNPFFVGAKRWGNNFHTLIYTGPHIAQTFGSSHLHYAYHINSNFHYMITGTRNFIGVEFNKEIDEHDFKMTIRPQMRVSLADNLIVGIVAGVPVSRQNDRLSSFVRLIYEPKHTH